MALSSTQPREFFVTGVKNFETALFQELRSIISQAALSHSLKKVYGGIEIRGTLDALYRVSLYSRLANRIYLPLARFKVSNEQSLYEQVLTIPWEQHLQARNSIAVSCTLSRSSITHSHFAALKVKDALVDYLRHKTGSRPSVDKQRPDLRIHVNIHQNRATISLDLSGQSLHRRGYRLQHSGAPLKENLAASILHTVGWVKDSWQETSLVDPMCGSGTFVIEAAMIAAGIAPGLNRDLQGFEHWQQHNPATWNKLVEEARNSIHMDIDCEIVGYDHDPQAIEIAHANAVRAGVSEIIELRSQKLLEFSAADIRKPPLFVSNPPYGERLEAAEGMNRLYQQIGKVVRQLPHASLHLISANPEHLHRLRLERSLRKATKNGPLDCVLVSYQHEAAQPRSTIPPESSDQKVQSVPAEAAAGLINRLKKNDKHLSRWAKRQGVSCVRLYDADLPEYAFALDRYQSAIDPDIHWFHLQEYQAPSNIPEETAAKRIQLAQQAIRQHYALDDNHLFVKLRQRQRGQKQYEKQGDLRERFQVREGQARLLVNFTDYLDTGLFLDHRLTRLRLAQQIPNKSLLNLFCYTGAFSVQAALAGAQSITSVDMSATYINWTRDNFELNELDDDARYQFIEADCLALLSQPHKWLQQQRFDRIVLDPPSFSNSKKMRTTLDIQRDHADIIQQASRLLQTDGEVWFSTNRKGFKLDPEIARQFQVEDITCQTIPEDFKRRPKIHQCWVIKP